MKTLKILLLVCAFGLACVAKELSLSTHVLDLGSGLPAANVKVELFVLENNQWKKIAEDLTSADGRIKQFSKAKALQKGIYKLQFHTKAYYQNKNMTSFYPFIEVVFEMDLPHHYHVPITLSPFGYSTYRGS